MTDVTKNNQKILSNNDFLTAYALRNFNVLAHSDLSRGVDDNDDTIIHLLAKNLDKDGLDQIIKINPGAITNTVLNKQNKNNETPLHCALDAIKKNQQSNQEFVDYLIELGANPNIPDKNHRVIIDVNNQSVDERANKINDLNDLVKQNIGLLMGEGKSVSDIDFIRKITDMYKQSGGYHGERKIKSSYDDMKYDSFVAVYKNDLMHDMNNQEKMKKEKMRNMQLFGGYTGGSRFDDTDDSDDMMESEDLRLTTEVENNYRDSEDGAFDEDSDEDFNDFRLTTDETFAVDLTSVNDDIDDIDDIDGVSDDLHIDEVSSSDDNYRNIWTSNERVTDSISEMGRPRNTEVDEIYRSFVTKIMDLLGVDEQTAKDYRTVIKVKIEMENPELRKRINDPLKVKEMETFFVNKKKLKSLIDSIDMDEIKKYMAERKKESEKRRQERESEKSEKPKKKNTKKKGKKETEKKDKASRVVDNGYLQSDEIIFSPEY